jgi:hypothetical protein
MNAKTLAKQYDQLTAEERFRLSIAAGARGDRVEQERLQQTAKRIVLSMGEHAPYAEVFDELALLFYIELTELAAVYSESLLRAHEARDDFDVEDEQESEEPDQAGADNEKTSAQAEEEDRFERTAAVRMLDIALANGFILKVKADGWRLWCQRKGIPPFALWEMLTGFDRVKQALKLTEGTDGLLGPAFLPEGMVRWLNRIKPEDGRIATVETIASAEKIADEIETLFQETVERRGG